MNHKQIGGIATIAMLFGLVTLAGCGPIGDRAEATAPAAPTPLPPGSITIFIESSYRQAHVIPVTLEDGTRCVTMVYAKGVGIACDFLKSK